MTNRDKFNAMNNATLAEILCRNKEYSICDFCSYIDDLMSNYSCHQSCFEGVKTWLDAPCKENPPADNPFANVDRTTKWMPKNGEEYVVPEISRGYPSWEDFVWNGTLRDELRYESGIVCRGAGEALKLAKKMLAVAKKESEQHD